MIVMILPTQLIALRARQNVGVAHKNLVLVTRRSSTERLAPRDYSV